MSQVQVAPGMDEQVFEAGAADRISNLPSSIITDHILDRLPLHEAARTSVLSKHWRHKWLLIPQLILDDFFFRVLKMEVRSGTSDDLQAYLNIVNNVIFRHVSPIRKFELSIPYWAPTSPNLDINQWIQFVSDNGTVKEFTLYEGRDFERKLPSALFSCLSLTHLTLQISGFVGPLLPTFSGFPCLTNLHLRMCRCAEVNTLEALISSCSQLEKLNLCICDHNVKITVCAPKLCDLVVRGCFSNVKLEATTTEINSLFINAEWLSKRGLSMLFSCLRNVETVVLAGSIWEARHFEKIPTVTNKLGQLKTLKLVGLPVNCFWAFPLAVSIIENSPHLQQLEIKVSYTCNFEVMCCDNILRIPENLSFQCLKHVALVCISGSAHDLQLMKLLLACCPVLEVMTIELKEETGQTQENLNIPMELMLCHRASENAEIFFK